MLTCFPLDHRVPGGYDSDLCQTSKRRVRTMGLEHCKGAELQQCSCSKNSQANVPPHARASAQCMATLGRTALNVVLNVLDDGLPGHTASHKLAPVSIATVPHLNRRSEPIQTQRIATTHTCPANKCKQVPCMPADCSARDYKGTSHPAHPNPPCLFTRLEAEGFSR